MPKKTENEKRKRATKPAQPQLVAEHEVLKGRYCNVAAIRHTEREFIFDFVLQLVGESILISRILTNPRHAKAVLKALGKNVEIYEKRFGPIPEDAGDPTLALEETRH